MPSYVYTNFDNETALVEITEEIHAFLEADDKRVQREERQAKRYERHFKPYSWNNFNRFSVPSCEEEYTDHVERLAREQQEQEIVKKIYEVLDTCTPKQRERFLLYAINGLTQREISNKYSCHLKSIQQSINVVLKKIKKSFEKS